MASWTDGASAYQQFLNNGYYSDDTQRNAALEYQYNQQYAGNPAFNSGAQSTLGALAYANENPSNSVVQTNRARELAAYQNSVSRGGPVFGGTPAKSSLTSQASQRTPWYGDPVARQQMQNQYQQMMQRQATLPQYPSYLKQNGYGINQIPSWAQNQKYNQQYKFGNNQFSTQQMQMLYQMLAQMMSGYRGY